MKALTVYVWLRIEDDDEVARLALRPALDEWLGSGLYPEPVRASGIEPGMSPETMTTVAAEELAIAGGREACRRSCAVRRRWCAVGRTGGRWRRLRSSVPTVCRGRASGGETGPDHSVIGAR